jgi:hypothetical protein
VSDATQPTTPKVTIQRSGFEPTGVKEVQHVYLNHLIITDIAGQPVGASYNFDYTVLIQLLHAHGFNPQHIQHIDRFVDAILRPVPVFLDFDRRKMLIRQEPDATKGAVGRMLKQFLDERRAEGPRRRDEHGHPGHPGR